jgi:sugar lactone lactonase YvrE
MLKLLTFCLLVALPARSLDHAHFIDLNKQASAFSKQQDWKSLREVLVEIGQEMPTATPNYMLRMASVETRLGHTAEALTWMQRYAATGLTYDVTKDNDLKPLATDKSFQPIAAQMQARSKLISHAELVCALPIPDLMPEDLTYDPVSGTFVVSSIQRHTLYRVTLPESGSSTDCKIKEIPLEESARHWIVMAVSYDAKRNLLWTTTSAIEGFPGISKQDAGKAALLALDPTSGKLSKRFDVEANGPAILGDMSVTPDGTVYFTDSLGGGVYRVRGDLRTATVDKIAGGLFSPQTPVLAQDGKRLFVADYPMGIAVINLASGKVDYLPHPEEMAVTGLDGLYLADDTLIGVQNGTDPERIVRLRLSHDQTAIASLEVVEQASPRLGEPTHAIKAQGMIYVTGNVGWSKIDDHGKLKPGEQFANPILLRFSAN